MFNIYRMLLLALKKDRIVKITSPQVNTVFQQTWVCWISSCSQGLRILITWWGFCGGAVICLFGKWKYHMLIFVRKLDWSKHSIPTSQENTVNQILRWKDFTVKLRFFLNVLCKRIYFYYFHILWSHLTSICVHIMLKCLSNHSSKNWPPPTLFSMKKQNSANLFPINFSKLIFSLTWNLSAKFSY